jgi:preprotein translocase subunit SecG
MDNITVMLLGLLILLTALLVCVPFFIQKLKMARASSIYNVQVADFFSQSNNNPGKSFVQLILFGAFRCIKTGNDGEDFLITKQQANFMKYATPEIAHALKKIGDSI